jgi:hypothetical protein
VTWCRRSRDLEFKCPIFYLEIINFFTVHEWLTATSASWESPRQRVTSTFAHDCATDSPPISKSSAESAEQADELPCRKIDDLSDATRIVQNDLSVKTAIPRSYRSHSCPVRLRSQSFFQLFLASFSTSVFSPPLMDIGGVSLGEEEDGHVQASNTFAT